MIRIRNLACASHEIMDGWLFSSYYAKSHRLRQGWVGSLHVLAHAWKRLCGHGRSMMKANNALIGKADKGGRTDRLFFGSFLAFRWSDLDKIWTPRFPFEGGKVSKAKMGVKASKTDKFAVHKAKRKL